MLLLGLQHAVLHQGGRHNECLLTSCSLGVVTKATAPPSASHLPLRRHAPLGVALSPHAYHWSQALALPKTTNPRPRFLTKGGEMPQARSHALSEKARLMA